MKTESGTKESKVQKSKNLNEKNESSITIKADADVKPVKPQLIVEFNDNKTTLRKNKKGLVSTIDIQTKDLKEGNIKPSNFKKILNKLDEDKTDKNIQDRINKSSKKTKIISPFINIENKDFEYLQEFVPDGFSFNDADETSTYDTLLEFALNEWGITIPENVPLTKKDIKARAEEIKAKIEWESRKQVAKAIAEKLDIEKNLSKELDKNLSFNIMLKNKQNVIREVQMYNAYCEPVTWLTLFFIANKSGGFHVMNLGRGGTGKSRSTLDLFKPNKHERIKENHKKQFAPFQVFANVYAISGHITPKRFFEILQLDGHIILDESYMLLQNAQIKNMLRSVLYDGEVVWYSKTGDQKHNFKGNIIFNSNQFRNKSLNDKALLDRLLVNNIKIDKEAIKLKINHRRNYKPNLVIWDLITSRIAQIRTEGLMESTKLTEKEKDFVDNFVLMELDRLPNDLSLEISMRVIERTEKIFMAMKTFFGSLDDDLRQFCKSLSANYFNVDYQTDVNSIIEKILTNPNLSTDQQLIEYKKATVTKTKPQGCSRSSFFNKKKELNTK